MMDCIFCGIINGELKGEILFQDDSVVALKDINPQAPVHLLLIPRKHIATLLDLEPGDDALMGHVVAVSMKLARDQGISESGFRLVANCGSGAGQSVFHIHFHLLGGRSMRWPPG
ncbi:MAG: HIT domain-containing protein [Deltaproteobacteria bacterium]|nr:HIT domain-containing protein [Deltaproteobacteria bacterium]